MSVAVKHLINTRITLHNLLLITSATATIFCLSFSADANFLPPPELTESQKKQLTEEQIKEYERSREAIFALLDPYTGKSIREAYRITDVTDLLNGIKSVSVNVFLNDQCANIISEQELKTKVELNLRRNGIRVSEKLGTFLSVTVHALRIEGVGYSFRTDIRVLNDAYTSYKDGYAKFSAYLWSDGSLGFAGSQKIKPMIIEGVIDAVERFSNAYLSQNPDGLVAPPAKGKPDGKKPALKK